MVESLQCQSLKVSVASQCFFLALTFAAFKLFKGLQLPKDEKLDFTCSRHKMYRVEAVGVCLPNYIYFKLQ